MSLVFHPLRRYSYTSETTARVTLKYLCVTGLNEGKGCCALCGARVPIAMGFM